MLTLVIYVSSIFMVEVVGKQLDLRDDPKIQYFWGNIPSAMFTLAQITTYEGWSAIVRYITEVKEMPAMLIFFVIYIAVSGFGIMNLVIGIMVTSALEVTKSDNTFQKNLMLIERHKALNKLRVKLQEIYNITGSSV